MANEVLFKITSEYTEAVLNETYKKYFAVKEKSYSNTLRWGGLVVLTPLAVLMLLLQNYLGAVVLAICALVAAYTLFLSRPVFVKRYIKNDKNGTLVGAKVATVKADSMTIASEGKGARYAFKDITGAWQTKNLFLLETSGGLLLMLDKRGFEKGAPEEFATFLDRALPPAALEVFHAKNGRVAHKK